MDASVIVSTFNKYSYLERTLKSFIAQRNAPEFEVLVVDDGSTDDTQELVETLQTDYPLRYLRNPVNMGRSRSRNVGLEEAGADIVIFVDDDRPVCEDFVYQHVLSGGSGKVVLGQRWETVEGVWKDPREVVEDDSLMKRFISVPPSDAAFRSRAAAIRAAKMRDSNAVFSAGAETKLDEAGNLYRGDGVMGMVPLFQWPIEEGAPLAWLLVVTGNLSAWREDVLRVGGFDEKFSGWGAEDTELGYRLSNAKTTTVFQPEAENYHLGHPKHPALYEMMYNNWQYFYQKHPNHDVGLFILYVLGHLPFAAYLSEVKLNSKSDASLFDDEALQILHGMCVLIDDIRKGYDVVLSLSPDVAVLDKGSDAIALLRSPLYPQFQCKSISLLCVDEAQELVLRFDGQTPLSSIVRAFQESRQASTLDDVETEVRKATAFLVREGVLCHHSQE
jgi:GT2 family glycosyltransferase